MRFGEGTLSVTDMHARDAMKTELVAVSQVLGCDYVYDSDATKERFFELASEATVVHIGKELCCYIFP